MIVLDSERISKAIKWRMGLLPDELGPRRDWEEIEQWLRADAERLEALANTMAQPLVQIILGGLAPAKGSESSIRWWNGLTKYLQDHPGISSTANAENYFNDAKFRFEGDPRVTRDQDLPTDPDASADDALPENIPGSSGSDAQEARPMTLSSGDEDEVTLPLTKELAGEQVTAPMNEASQAADEPESNQSSQSSQSTQWRYLPVPDDPDKHTEFDEQTGESPEGLKIIGARARGKKHKHEGTNCDDWFKFANSGTWTIIAVSDGAGSKVFSRIGAEDSCATAVQHLSKVLANHSLDQRDSWTPDTFKSDKQSGAFVEEDLEYVQRALHEAMQKAYEAVEAKALKLAESAEHFAILKRKVTIDDLSGTMLLAVHTTVAHPGGKRSFILTCQIGDGMLAAIDSKGGLQLLGVADSGEFAGQTEFLTSKKKVEKSSLSGRTRSFFGPLQALMVMTDGVADDYFPNDPGMLSLYGDLAINGILHLSGIDPKEKYEKVDASLAKTRLTTKKEVQEAGFASTVETIAEGRGRQILIRSFNDYAEKLGLRPKEVVASLPLLIAGTTGEPLCEERESEVMLRVWLDAYQVRGSFDDRTLVVLYREVAG